MVMVNLPTAGVDYHVPFGGRKGSSYGPREQGRYARGVLHRGQDGVRRAVTSRGGRRLQGAARRVPSTGSPTGRDRLRQLCGRLAGRLGPRRRRLDAQQARGPGGSHQFQRPRSATAAGARTPRMIVASIRMPPPSAVANIFASVPGVALKATNARPRISAALVTSRPGAADALDDRGLGRAGAVVGLAHAADDEHLVVHRDAEQEGEDDDRHLDVDRLRSPRCPRSPPSRSRAGRRARSAPTRRATESRFSRTALSGRTSERNARASSTNVEHGDERDHQREVAVDRVEEVGALRGLAADRRVGGQRAWRGRGRASRGRRASCRPRSG